MEIKVSTLQDLESSVPRLIEGLAGRRIITLEGDLGAGKTTLVKMLCTSWGVEDLVSSPTYNLVNLYRTSEGMEIKHLDLYRIDSLDEALAAGIEEYLYSDGITLIEWPEVIGDILPQDVAVIHIRQEGNDERKIVLL